MDLGLDGRVYIVSGASQGLGFASAEKLAADGARLVLGSRSRDRVEQAAQRLGKHAVGVAVDLSDAGAAETLVRTALERFDRLDGAVISVGGPPAGPLSATTDDQWRGAFESVFLGSLRLARAVLAHKEPVAVTFVLSTSVRTPLPNLAVSNGLRPGLAMAAKTLADEYGPRGSRVNVVLPGRILTGRIHELEEASGDPAQARRAEEAAIPLRRLGTPEEFGTVVAFVTSPAAAYMSGSAVTVDGGATRAL
ncbi:MAG TPA: SDR family oxidoreductase [Dermatophilaceae bacterium]|nr:SDR family oxidoreductase [Dermatophilaceae bacterium]